MDLHQNFKIKFNKSKLQQLPYKLNRTEKKRQKFKPSKVRCFKPRLKTVLVCKLNTN